MSNTSGRSATSAGGASRQAPPRRSASAHSASKSASVGPSLPASAAPACAPRHASRNTAAKSPAAGTAAAAAPPIARALSSSTSPKWRVSPSGCIAGCCKPRTPGRGSLSPQASSGVWVGSTRSARLEVSSGQLAVLTTSPTCAAAAAKRAPPGMACAGLTPPSSNTSISPASIAAVRSSSSRCVPAWFQPPAVPGSSPSASNRTVTPVLPATWFSRWMAVSVAVASGPLAATPPPTASVRPLPCAGSAKRRARLRIVAAGTPARAATCSGAWSATRSKMRPAASASAAGSRARPSARMACTRAAATSPSVPGSSVSHSSAWAPVSDNRGSSCTSRVRRPPPRRRPSANARLYSTGDSHVSRKSAPNDTIRSGRAKSWRGTPRRPNAVRLAARRASWANGS